MAGRPATGSTTGIIVGMCVGIGIAVVALVFLVILWTNQEELMAQAKKDNDEANRVMSSSERNGALRSWFDKGSPRQSSASLMAAELNAFAKLVTGDDASVEPDYVSGLSDEGGELDSLWSRIDGDESIDDPGTILDQPLVTALEEMYKLYADANNRADQLQTSLDAATTERDQCTAEKKALDESFTAKAEELKTRVTDIEDDVRATAEAQTAMLDEIKSKSEARAEEAQQTRISMTRQIEDAKMRLAETEEDKRQLQERVREFQVQPRSGGRARSNDGEVVLATAGSGAAFINLGARDKMILGLRFAVYSSNVDIPASGKAKGALEVIGIGDDASECRILWDNAANPIIQGDVIANPVYDRNRSLMFAIIGEFDFDYDGLDDVRGREHVESIITEAGGTVVEDVSARVDFLIVGARPLVRQPGKNATPEDTALYEDDLAALNDYAAAFELARSLSVPMLTQDTFLNFLGRRY